MGTNKKAFHLRWDNHMESMRSLFERSFYDQALTDVTLSCPDGKLKGHKLILSACSPYFESVFKENPCKHPVLIFKEVKHREMSLLLEYMYRGEVDVLDSELQALIQTASDLQVRGLAYGFQTETTVATARNPGFASATSVPNSLRSELPGSETESLVSLKMPDMAHVATPKSRSLTITKVIPEDAATAVTKEESHTPRLQGQKRTAGGSPDNAPKVKIGFRASPPYPLTNHQKSTESSAHMISKLVPDMRTVSALSSNGIDFSVTINNGSASNGIGVADQNGSIKLEDGGILVLRGRPEDLTKTPTKDSVSKEVTNDLAESDDDDHLGGELEININEEISIKEEVDEEDDEEEETLGYLCESSFTEGDATNGLLDKSEGNESIEGKEAMSTVCPFCFMDFKTADVLRKHVQIHTANPRPHQCEVCKLSFGRSSHLERHRRTHTGERPFACPILNCGKRFARQDKVKQHVGRHHNADSRITKQKAPRMNKPRPPQVVIPGKRPRGRPRKYPETYRESYPEAFSQSFPEGFMVGHQMTEEPSADRGISSNSIAAADMLLQLSSNGSHSQNQPTDFSNRVSPNAVPSSPVSDAVKQSLKPELTSN